MQVCNEVAKRKCIGRMFEERKLNILSVTEAKFKGEGYFIFGTVNGTISSTKTRRA